MELERAIRKIWHECFPADTAEWINMYFTMEYQPDRALIECDAESGDVVSSMLLLPYAMTFHGETVGASYVSGAATRRRYRGRGYMSRLMTRALVESARMGQMLCMLVPADARLYHYYAHFGFAPVFYSRLLRYTSVHVFQYEGLYHEVDAYERTRLYEAFSRMMGSRGCCVQHSRSQFETIMTDSAMSGDLFAAVADDSGEVRAMAWGRNEDSGDVVRVTELLCDDTDAMMAVMSLLQSQCPGKSLTIMDMAPDDSSRGLEVRGMARLTRVDRLLEIIARSNPELRFVVRVSDPVICGNHAVYRIGKGRVDVLPYESAGGVKLDLDVPVNVLAGIVFGSRKVGDVIGLPADRPHLSLMLE